MESPSTVFLTLCIKKQYHFLSSSKFAKETARKRERKKQIQYIRRFEQGQSMFADELRDKLKKNRGT